MPLTALDDRVALVVIDLQLGILGLPTVPIAPTDVLERSSRLAEAFRARGATVVLVRVTQAADGADAVPGRTDASRAISRQEGWDQLAPEIGPLPGDVIVTKRNWSAFYGTDLDLQLRRRGVTQIVLTGVATSIGVESTARAAHEHGYHVVLATDAMADGSQEAHDNSVARIFPRLGQTSTTEELLDRLSAPQPSHPKMSGVRT